MVIGLKDKNNNLKIKDILDLNIDMSVEPSKSKYRVRITKNFWLDNEFDTMDDAEEAMYNIANIRNEIEEKFFGDN